MRWLRWPLTALSVVGLAACVTAAPPSSSGGASTSSSAASASSAESVSASAPPSPSASVSACHAMAAGLTLEQQVGQLFMIAVDTAGLNDVTVAAIAESEVGSAVLLGESSAGADFIGALAGEISALNQDIALLVAVDQEGGNVQRLTGPGFSDIPTAVEQGQLSAEELRGQAAFWGQELADAGVHYNLAPVADVVPEDKLASNAPIGALRRNFGVDPGSVSTSVTSYVQGMSDAGVLTSLKHFPGLGQVSANTDEAVAIDEVITTTHPSLAAFEAGIEAGADSVMISSAIFQQIDPENEGVFSEIIVTKLLREQLGFKGVAIADDLGVAGAVSDIAPAERAVRFFEAGGDLAINADPSIMGAMTEAVVQRAIADEAFAARVKASAGRVLELKQKVGLLNCG